MGIGVDVVAVDDACEGAGGGPIVLMVMLFVFMVVVAGANVVLRDENVAEDGRGGG